MKFPLRLSRTFRERSQPVERDDDGSPVARPPPTVRGESGTTYIVKSRVGSGAFASVYEVKRTGKTAGTEERLVLKYDNKSEKRDGQEVAALRAVSGHKCFVALVDHVQVLGRGNQDMIMERLDYSLNLLTLQGVATPERLNTEVVRQLLTGLVRMERLGIVHKDIHFDNIMVDMAAGQVKFIDFGLARIFKHTDDRATREQAMRDDARCVGEIALYLPLHRYSTAKETELVPSVYSHLPRDSEIRKVMLLEDTTLELMSVFYGLIHNLDNLCDAYTQPNCNKTALEVHHANMMSPSLNGFVATRDYAEMVWALLSPYAEWQPSPDEILRMDAFTSNFDVDLGEEFRAVGLTGQPGPKQKES